MQRSDLKFKRFSWAQLLAMNCTDRRWLNRITGETADHDSLHHFLCGTASLRVSQKRDKYETVELSVSWVPLAIQYKIENKRRYIYFEQINEIRLGSNTDGLRRASLIGIPENLTFSIMYSCSLEKHKVLNFVMPTTKAAIAWTTWLTEMFSMNWNDQYFRLIVNVIEEDTQNLKLFSPGFENLWGCSADCLRKPRKEWAALVNILQNRQNISDVFNTLAESKVYISFNKFLTFMRETQKSSNTNQEIESIYFLYSNSQNQMLKSHFIAFLISSLNSMQEYVNKPLDMNRPITDYYINTSHNTYLISKQIGTSSSLEGYIRALMNGCRCVEIDCHDGSDGMPIVYHKGAFTSKIQFIDVIRTINKYAFVVSPYPLIISLEIHCSERQRNKMASILIKILGKSLTIDTQLKNSKSLPSPEALKYKILIRGKLSRCMNSKPYDLLNSKNVTSPPTLQDLITYFRTHTIHSYFVQETTSYDHKKSFSLSERNSIDFKNIYRNEYFDLNKRFPVRVYPSAIRVLSSNFNPLPHWTANCSMVAMNHQTKDKMMEIYSALFELNRNCGYVLKPERMLSNSNGLNSAVNGTTSSVIICLISLHILQVNPPLKRPDLCIEIELIEPIRSLKKCSSPVKYRSTVLSWNESFSFTLSDCDLAFIRFRVFKANYSIGNFSTASRTVSYKALGCGYRSLMLNSKEKCCIIPPSLLVYIEK